MPSSPAIPSPDAISLEAFRALLARYPAVLQAVSDAKGSKPGQTPLAELDAFRYETAPGRYATPAPADAMTLDDVKMLVSWKLRHGKFRPTLMRLVESNPPATVQETVQDALRAYGRAAPAPDTPAAVRVLCRLRGVGPATASLLLAVHDPARVVFFGDEVYAWLCGGSGVWQRPQKYNDGEYAALCAATAALQARLGDGVQAADVEKVAYVLLAGNDGGAGASKQKATAKDAKKKAAATPKNTKTADAAAAARKPKRKRPASDEHGPDAPASETGAPLRRTERVRRLR